MTQFVLFSADEPQRTEPPFLKVSLEKDSFLSGVALSIFPHTAKESIFTIALNGRSFDTICTAAQVDLADGKKFSETSLFLCIEWLLESCTSLVFWYGSDYEDLDCVNDRESLLENIQGALIDSSCEIYLRYEREVCIRLR